MMAQPDYRLAGAALQLRRFTARGLAEAADTNVSTARTWLQRNDRYVEADPETSLVAVTAGKGRPQKMWRLRDGAVPALRELLNRLFPLRSNPPKGDANRAARLGNIAEVETHLKMLERARRFNQREAMQVAEVSARTWIRIAWEDLAALDQQDDAVPQPMLEHLAALESQLGVGDLPSSSDLSNLAVWATQRLIRMCHRGATSRFAARALRARVEVRGLSDRARLSAASVAAPVWADEGYAEVGGVDVASMSECRLIAEVLSPVILLQELDMAVDRRPAYSFCSEPFQAQAVLLGVAELQIGQRDMTMRDWLSFRMSSNDWIPEFAPPILYGLAEAHSTHWPRLFSCLQESLRIAADRAKSWNRTPGRLRGGAWAFADRALRRALPAEVDPAVILAGFGRQPA